jgi:hypothetical protein
VGRDEGAWRAVSDEPGQARSSLQPRERYNRAILLGASKPAGQHAQAIDNIHGQS